MAAAPAVVGYRHHPGGAGHRGRRQAWLLSLVLVLVGVLMLLPVVWVVLQSVELPTDQFNLPPVWFPSTCHAGQLPDSFRYHAVHDNILNSVLVTGSVVIGAAVVSVLAAYAFARLEFRGREIVFTLFLASFTLPTQVLAVPEFVVVKNLHLLNTQASLIIPALIQVFGVFLLRQHFRTIPRELEDAAKMDGAGHLRIIRHVMVPLSWPAISAVMVDHRPVHLERLFLAQPFHQRPQPDDRPPGAVLPGVGHGRR